MCAPFLTFGDRDKDRMDKIQQFTVNQSNL